MGSIGNHRRPARKRGDTLLAWSLEFKTGTTPLDIASARMQLRFGARRVLVAEMVCTVEGGRVDIAAYPNTSNFPIGSLMYDIELTLADGRILTPIEGVQPIVEDYTYDE